MVVTTLSALFYKIAPWVMKKVFIPKASSIISTAVIPKISLLKGIVLGKTFEVTTQTMGASLIERGLNWAIDSALDFDCSLQRKTSRTSDIRYTARGNARNLLQGLGYDSKIDIRLGVCSECRVSLSNSLGTICETCLKEVLALSHTYYLLEQREYPKHGWFKFENWFNMSLDNLYAWIAAGKGGEGNDRLYAVLEALDHYRSRKPCSICGKTTLYFYGRKLDMCIECAQKRGESFDLPDDFNPDEWELIGDDDDVFSNWE